MTSGASATSAAASPGTERSPARVATAKRTPAGLLGSTMSCSVSCATAFSPIRPSRTSRSMSFRPIMPAAPVIRTCIGIPRLKREPAVHHVDRAGGVGRFIGGEIDHQRRDLRGRAEAADGLAVDEVLANLLPPLAGLLHGCRKAFVERRRLDCAGAHGVDADAFLDVVGLERLGESDPLAFDSRMAVAV